MTITSQSRLDESLDRIHTFNVEISPHGPLPITNSAYNSIRNLAETGFTFTPRELLHAIGCKTAALPVTSQDECLKAAWLYTYILDFESPYLAFRGTYGSDLQGPRSSEIGIGMMCLLAKEYFSIPWDQLAPLPGRGMRFDYRGTNGRLDCIFESKGTSHLGNQKSQIDDGLAKKEAHHRRGECFDVELIISSYIGRDSGAPRMVLADPAKASFRELYEKGDNRYHRLKHYCRVLQFIGLPDSAYRLNRYARDYLYFGKSLRRTIIDEKRREGFLKSLKVGGDEFLGRWFDSWLPKHSKRYSRLYGKEKELDQFLGRGRSVFQGVRKDVYEAAMMTEPFSHSLLTDEDTARYESLDKKRVSVFPDGTIMVFKQV